MQHRLPSLANSRIMDSEVVFMMFKNMIIKQNKELLKRIAKDHGKSENALLDRYIKPDYYLPIIQSYGSKKQ